MQKTPQFLIVTHVPHILFDGKYFAYGPYVREMNIWLKYVEKFVLISPLIENAIPSEIDLAYQFNPAKHKVIKAMHFSSGAKVLSSIFSGLTTFGILMREMSSSSHIHLRCPGNVGLIGCFAQIFFPFTKKTAKYAGNWDWRSNEPLSYRIQQYILRSPILTSSMQTLVYGNWPDKTINIKPFFTASYSESEKEEVNKSLITGKLKLIFVGALEKYKSPELVIETAKLLKSHKIDFSLTFCGDGSQRVALENLALLYELSEHVRFLGNVSSHRVKKELKESHLLVFISQSEGWPKAVAEAMFWGCVPVTTDVSCVGDMVGRNQERGVLVVSEPTVISQEIIKLINNPSRWEVMSHTAMNWSRTYTLEYFDTEIRKLI